MEQTLFLLCILWTLTPNRPVVPEEPVIGLLLPILLGIFAAAIGELYLLRIFRQQRPGDPLLDKGLITWLGHVVQFLRDTFEFLQKKWCCDVFTLQLWGPYSFRTLYQLGQFVTERWRQQLVHGRTSFGYEIVVDDRRIVQMFSNKPLKGLDYKGNSTKSPTKVIKTSKRKLS